MTDLSNLAFFITPSHPCSYLKGQQAVTLFADPKAGLDTQLYSQLSYAGFRRSGDYLYKPHCQSCQACIPARLQTSKFTPSKRQRRISRKNQDLTIHQVKAVFDQEHYQLYADYIEARHQDGDMYPPSEEQYKSFLFCDWSNTFFLEFRLEGKLIAVAVTDPLNNALSAVYSFYDAKYASRSLGVYAVLSQIAITRDANLSHLYLGYWISENEKMSYKKEYRPLEILTDNAWQPLLDTSS
ncbi:MAG: arginyltransferase [Gammaproteobacteria bacterium]|nr:MAG: arginyltransferase [Gammaproteobacteria bacterium]